MQILNLPAELLLDIIQSVPSVRDKCQLLQTCTAMRNFFSTHVRCWSRLDLSSYATLSNSILLRFLKENRINLITSTGTAVHGISELDLSGCWCLSQEMVMALTKSFSSLDGLFLNGYRLKGSNKLAFEHQRDHVYQVRPSHDLSSMAMDLSKKSTNRLKVPSFLISSILAQVPSITALSMQYQDISPSSFTEFNNLQYLDISSCAVSAASLQSLLRKNRLVSLKMLNIELTDMTWLCIAQFCKKLKCLHVSCHDVGRHFPCIRQALSNLKELQDFRMTRVAAGRMDGVITELMDGIRRLDVSPKMNIYPKGGGNGGKHPVKRSISSYATTEHDLLATDVSLHHLSKCHHLVELRLCFPTISSDGLHALFRSIPQLEVFELRQHKEEGGGRDYLKGLGNLINLNRIYLYSVSISSDAMDTFPWLPRLRHLTTTHGGQWVNEQRLMKECRRLESLEIGSTANTISFLKRDHHWLTIK
ncbi:uncharacterized protein EV154DRAFT_520357 [Mucor mucedo]|uniref:uncharacterized protein n=1 Tax=Mucor mucedo TaxID=29922 RepID=UPI00221EF23A|nr:uncharacterized protein EV154DRAFT_520357 [Mucor mucedo]KAI7887660.1 hypothetical protein EV154DRAFT_520357 [Mucor mucedo]